MASSVFVAAVVFGFRHGFDWDHIAALTDLTGSQAESRRSMGLATLYALGHAAMVMGLGTAITVASLAVLAVSARKTAFTLTRADSPLGRKVIRGVEICGALAVLLFGTLLLVGNIFLQ